MSSPEVSTAVLVHPGGTVHVSADTYPWINPPECDIRTSVVGLPDAVSFIYGSIIGLNTSLQKIAHGVSYADSVSTQHVLFAGLSDVLRGQPHPGISKVENANLKGTTLFVASRNVVQGASLVFGVEPTTKYERPLVLRAGICGRGDFPKILGLMGIRQPGGRRRRI